MGDVVFGQWRIVSGPTVSCLVQNVSIQPAALYVVATPIGNLGDISLRAREVLAAVDRVYAEDTRHSRRLFQHLGFSPSLHALHDHNEGERAAGLVERLLAGESAALISDAGTPLVSDPGYRVVRACQDAGVAVVPVPGASAPLAALCVSGLATDRFAFEGFLPAKSGARRARMSELVDETRTLVFFESSHRIADSLVDFADVFGGTREATMARELTKQFETVRRATLAELRDWVREDSNQQRGEFVLVVAGAPAREAGEVVLRSLLEALLDELPPRRAAAVAAKLTGVKKNQAYQVALGLRAAPSGG